MIFETERLLVRKLKETDIKGYFELQSNPKVLQYATGEVESYEKIQENLLFVISKYNVINNDFWIYAVERKLDNEFLGTVALVKDEDNEDEIGFRFLEKFWNKGYGFEVCQGLITYAKQIGISKLIANVVDVNVGSAKIVERLNFTFVKEFISEDIKLPETKYELVL